MPSKDKRKIAKYQKLYREKNKDKLKKQKKLYYKNNKLYFLNYSKQRFKNKKHDIYNYYKDWMKSKRIELITILGGSCSCKKCELHRNKCKITNFKVLEFDHIKNNGKEDRKKLKNSQNFCKYYLNNIYKAKKQLQLLCSNCHVIKTKNDL